MPNSAVGSYFKEQSSGEWELQISDDPASREYQRLPVGFVTTGFVRGSKKPTAVPLAFCEAVLLAHLREEQWKEMPVNRRRKEIYVLVRNLRSISYRLALATIVLEQQEEDDVVDLTGDGGVIKKIVTRAKAGAIAPSEDLPLVDVHYEGTLAETGEVFDTTHEHNSVFSFEIGQGSVIQGWDIALKTMKVGEVSKLTCNPEYAYGAAGSPHEIPPNATLIFEVELLSCKPRKGSSLGSASAERTRLVELKKQRELAAAVEEDEKKKREEEKTAAAARMQAKMGAKKGQGKGKGKAK